MRISEVDIYPIKHQLGLLAFASRVIDDALFLSSIGVHSKIGGGFRLTYPTKQVADRNINIFHPINKETSLAIEEAIIEKYKKVMKGGNYANEIDQTHYWDNPDFQRLTTEAKLALLFFLVNDKVNHTGVYRMSNRAITYHLGFDTKTITNIRKELIRFKNDVIFCGDWVYCVGAQERCGYFNEKSQKAIAREMKEVDEKALSNFRRMGYTIPYQCPME